MKNFSFLLCFYVLQIQAAELLTQTDPVFPQSARLAMGFYYPSLDNVSSRTEIQIALNYWIKELTEKIELENSYSILYDDIIDMSNDFQKGKLDMVIAPPLLLSIYFNRELLSDGFMGVKSKEENDQLVIIARSEVGKYFTDFLGKRLLLLENDLLVKIFLETETLKQYRQTYQEVFSSVMEEKKNDRIILALFFGRADISVVYLSALEVMIELNPQIAEKIKILKTFPVKSTSYGYFYRDYPYQDLMRSQASAFNSASRGKQILELFHTSLVKICTVDELKRFDSFYHAYHELKKIRNE